MHAFGTLLFAFGMIVTVPACLLSLAAPGMAGGVVAGVLLVIVGLLMRIAGKPAAAAPATAAPNPQTHVRCPDCAEFVLREARVCKHCGATLVPQPAQEEGSVWGEIGASFVKTVKAKAARMSRRD